MKYNCRYTYWPPRISLQTWLTSKSRKTRQALQYSSNIIIFWWNERSSDVDLAYFPSSGFPHFRYWQIPNYFRSSSSTSISQPKLQFPWSFWRKNPNSSIFPKCLNYFLVIISHWDIFCGFPTTLHINKFPNLFQIGNDRNQIASYFPHFQLVWDPCKLCFIF